MKISKNWLKDYIEFDYSDSELSDILTFSGTLVESFNSGLDPRVLVVKISAIVPHPNADRLRLATVQIGEKEITVVCGAPNIEVGQKVPLAQIGTKLGEVEIKEVEIRGVKSLGMLCSEKELGLGEDHTGIKILPDNYEIGKPLSEYLGQDTIFDLEITQNRGDCLSHIGVSRELSASTSIPMKNNENIKFKCLNQDKFKVEIKNPENCYRYFAAKISGVTIKPSPDWLQKRLLSMDTKPISNIVDITNYILYGLGQPLHAFDANKIVGNSIIVRNAIEGEFITTLEGTERKLDSDMLMISDSEKSVAIGGVMGGLNSEIDSDTCDIILESAEFDRVNIRRTSKNLKLVTEASYRFERGVNPIGVEFALDQAISMITKIAGGKLEFKVQTIAKDYKNLIIEIEYKKINDLIGINIDNKTIDEILIKLGFEVKNGIAIPPSWRHDITLWQDLAEEVSRIYGFNKIEHQSVPKTEKPARSSYFVKERIKDILVDSGFCETYTYSFLSDEDLKVLGLHSEDLIEVANPIQSENKYLRKSLKPGLLRAVAKNPTFDSILLFEIGNVFTKENESSHLAFVASGKNAKKNIENALNNLSMGLNIDLVDFKLEELNRDDLTRFKIKKPVSYLVEINLSSLLRKINISEDKLALKIYDKAIHYRPISKYPSVPRDLAFIVDKTIKSEQIIDEIYSQSELINRVELFDEFESDKLGTGKKNLAFHLDLQHLDKTLKDAEADQIINKVISTIENKFSAKLRNY